MSNLKKTIMVFITGESEETVLQTLYKYFFT